MLMYDNGNICLASDLGTIFFCLVPVDKNKQKGARSMVIYTPQRTDGAKLFAVATELVMTLYALLYAYPHIPTSLVDDVDTSGDIADGEVQWYSVRTPAALRAAMEALLRTSQVLEVSLRPGLTVAAITGDAVADAEGLSDIFDLQLYAADDIPATCRQLYESLAVAYRAVVTLNVNTREDLWALLQRYQLIPIGYQLPGTVRVESENRSDLLRFCSELAVDYLQPYFAKHEAFYHPRGAATACTSPA
jgi:hypothetical protein